MFDGSPSAQISDLVALGGSAGSSQVDPRPADVKQASERRIDRSSRATDRLSIICGFVALQSQPAT